MEIETNLSEYQTKVLDLLKQGWHIRTCHSWSRGFHFLELYSYDKDGKATCLKKPHDAGIPDIEGHTHTTSGHTAGLITLTTSQWMNIGDPSGLAEFRKEGSWENLKGGGW